MKNPNLDFAEFAAKIIKAVDDIRSFGGATTTTPTASSNRPTESRINAFYRLLGLPSIIPNTIPEGRTRASSQDPLNTGNQFAGNAVGISDDSELSRLSSLRERSYLQPITDEEAKRFVHSNTSKLDDGVPADDQTDAKRARGNLFPMIVFGEVPVFPQDRRVADAFLEKSDRIVEDSEYRPPFIEAVILTRLKGEGVTDPQLQQQLEEDFGIAGQDLNILQANIVKALAESSNTIIDRLAKTVTLINESTTEFSAHSVPGINTVAEARQEFSKDIETAGSVEKRQAREEARERLQNSLLFAMEFANDGTKNMRDTPLMNELISLTGNQESTDGRKNETKNISSKTKKDVSVALEKTQKKARQAFRELEFLLGTFSGLSGVDVIVIIEALFEININQLIGLLNDDAKLRLEALKGATSSVGVADSVTALETKVKEIYSRIMSGANTRKHKEKLSSRR